jgi:phage tail-like protein
MPDLVGMPYRKAKLLCDNSGLVLDYIVFSESYEARNTVLQQIPQRGQMIYVGDRVGVAISRDSYVRWLPAIYQRSDLSGRNFVKELLWVTQHLFGSVEEILNVGHTYYDPYEAPEHFLPWLASWTAMILEEDWPVSKKRRLIKRAVELYRIRGTLRGIKLFIALFTGHEPEIRENEWPFKGWRVGQDSRMGIDTVVLPPVNLAHTFVVEMPTAYKDLSPEAVIRIHEIVRMEKPAHSQYYLRFAAEERDAELREFFVIGTRSGIGIGQEILREGGGEDITPPLVVGEDQPLSQRLTQQQTATKTQQMSLDDFSTPRTRRPLPKAPRADNAPVEGREVRSSEEGFGASARAMQAIHEGSTMTLEAKQDAAPTTVQAAVEPETSEHAVTRDAEGTMVSSTPERIAAEIKKSDARDANEPTRVHTKKPDPKKSK